MKPKRCANKARNFPYPRGLPISSGVVRELKPAPIFARSKMAFGDIFCRSVVLPLHVNIESTGQTEEDFRTHTYSLVLFVLF